MNSIFRPEPSPNTAVSFKSVAQFPNLLYKPIRSVYYTLKGNLAMMKQDFDSAEINMKKGLDLGMPMKEAEGASLLQKATPCNTLVAGLLIFLS